MIVALSLLVAGLVPFVFVEASHWWWLRTLPANNNIGFTDAAIMSAVRAVVSVATLLVAGAGFIWACSLLPKQAEPTRGRAILVLKIGLALFTLPWFLAIVSTVAG